MSVSNSSPIKPVETPLPINSSMASSLVPVSPHTASIKFASPPAANQPSLYSGNYGIDDSNHWDLHLNKLKQMPRLEDSIKFRLLKTINGNTRQEQERWTNHSTEESDLANQVHYPLVQSVLNLSKKYSPPCEPSHALTWQQIDDMRWDKRIEREDQAFQEEAEDRTFLTSFPLLENPKRTSTAQECIPNSLRDVPPPISQWNENSSIHRLVESLLQYLNSISADDLLMQFLPEKVHLSSSLQAASSFTMLSPSCKSLATSDISIRLVSECFFIFLITILGGDDDMVQYCEWQNRQRNWEEKQALLQANGEKKIVSRQASKEKIQVASTSCPIRYTYYGLAEHIQTGQGKCLQQTDSSSFDAATNESSRFHRASNDATTTKPDPFRPHAGIKSGPFSFRSFISNHKCRERLSSLLSKLMTSYMHLQTLTAPYLKDSLNTFYYDLVAEALYHSYLASLSKHTKLIDTPMFRTRLLQISSALLIGYVPHGTSSDHWLMGGVGSAAKHRRMSALDYARRSSTSSTLITSTVCVKKGHVNTTLKPMVLIRQKAKLIHSPLVNQFITERHLHHKHLRLELPMKLSFPMQDSIETLLLTTSKTTGKAWRALQEYKDQQCVEKEKEQKECMDLETCKRLQNEERKDALLKRAEFAKKLVEASQSEKFLNLKMDRGLDGRKNRGGC